MRLLSTSAGRRNLTFCVSACIDIGLRVTSIVAPPAWLPRPRSPSCHPVRQPKLSVRVLRAR